MFGEVFGVWKLLFIMVLSGALDQVLIFLFGRTIIGFQVDTLFLHLWDMTPAMAN